MRVFVPQHCLIKGCQIVVKESETCQLNHLRAHAKNINTGSERRKWIFDNETNCIGCVVTPHEQWTLKVSIGFTHTQDSHEAYGKQDIFTITNSIFSFSPKTVKFIVCSLEIVGIVQNKPLPSNGNTFLCSFNRPFRFGRSKKRIQAIKFE